MYDRVMSGLQRTLQFLWLLLTIAMVVWHFFAQQPFHNAKDAATLLALLALSIRALMTVWRWADLAWRKLWLWLLNSSVNWTLEVRVSVPETIEDAEIEMMLNAVRDARKQDRVARIAGTDRIVLDTDLRYSMTIRPMQSGMESYWLLRFNPVHIGYRDASRILQRVFVPIIDSITSKISNTGDTLYSIEARFSNVSPYAAVLLNELRAKSADRILLSFKQDGSTLQLTKDSIVSSSSSQADAIQAMSAVFGLSLRGALSAGNV